MLTLWVELNSKEAAERDPIFRLCLKSVTVYKWSLKIYRTHFLLLLLLRCKKIVCISIFNQIYVILLVRFLSSQLLFQNHHLITYVELFLGKNEYQSYYKKDHQQLRVAVLMRVKGCSKVSWTALILPSDNIRPKLEAIGYIIRCSFENYFKPCDVIQSLNWPLPNERISQNF